jgi:cytochrome b561
MKSRIKRCVDIILAVVLLALMSYQATGEKIHEWTGIAMTVIVISHLIMNLKFFSAIPKGKYNAYRTVLTLTDILLLLCFFMTALCGMSMSSNAVPFLNGIIPVSFARTAHLALSYWSFAFMGLHIGYHLSAPITKTDKKKKAVILSVIGTASAFGIYLLVRNGIFGYMFLINRFAFFDYDKSAMLVILENLLMLFPFIFSGTVLSLTTKKKVITAI